LTIKNERFGGENGNEDLTTLLLTTCLRGTFNRRLTVNPIV